jgi:hypothetical protein
MQSMPLAAPSNTVAEPTPLMVNTRTRSASPTEEWRYRRARCLEPIRLTEAEFAVLLYGTRMERVENDGAIRFKIGEQPLEYYHVDSQTCQRRRGERVLIAFSWDFLDAIYVLTDQARYIETIPLKGALRWFDYARLGTEIREQEIALKRAAKELEHLGGAEIRQKHYAGRGNVERVNDWRDGRISHVLAVPQAPEISADDSQPITAPATTRRAAEAPAATGGSSHQERAEREADVLLGGEQPRRFDVTPSESITGAVPPRASAPLLADSGLVTPIGAPRTAPAAESSTAPLPALAEQLLAKQSAARAQQAAAPQRAADARAAKHRVQADLLD